VLALNEEKQASHKLSDKAEMLQKQLRGGINLVWYALKLSKIQT
jgi:hypothetical protein